MLLIGFRSQWSLKNEVHKIVEKSLKNTCGGVFFKNVVDLEPVDLLKHDLCYRHFLKTWLKLSKDLFEQVMMAASIVQ